MRLTKIFPGLLGMAAVVFAVNSLAVGAPTELDEIVLNNGSRILGTVTGARDGLVSVDTDFAGSLKIKFEDIASLRTRAPMPLQLADKTVIEPQEMRLEGEQVAVEDAAGVERNYALGELRVLNPEPWELGKGYRWTGLVSFASAVQRGNTDLKELDYLLDTKWRSDDDRYTLLMSAELDESNGIKNADNWKLIGKYDYFLSDLNYWGVNAYAESDEFADLNLRWYAGPYFGREFYTQPVFQLSAELGASFVSEDFMVAEDKEYPAANWTLNMSSNYLGGDSRLYFNQLGIWNLDEMSDVVVKTYFGLAFPLLWKLEAAAEISLEYDSGAQAPVEELDETYKLRIGYTW